MRVFALLVVAILYIVAVIQAQNTVCPIDLVFLLDRSGSICDSDPTFKEKGQLTCSNWDRMKEFVVTFIDGIEIGSGADEAHVGLVTFDSSARVEWDLKRFTNKETLVREVQSLPYIANQHTHMADALEIARMEIFGHPGDRIGSPNVVIVATDGLPYDEKQMIKVIPSADALKRTNVQLFTVGVQTRDMNETILQMISSEPHQKNKNYFMSTGFNDLPLIATIKNELSSTVCRPPSTTTTTTTTTTVTQNTPGCLLDILFLVDRSGSMCDADPNFNRNTDKTCDNYESEKRFIADFISNIDVGHNGAQVAVVTFDTGARINWGLSRYTDKDLLIQQILNIDYNPNQHTHMADAFNLVKQVFSRSDDRPDVDNIVVIVTDGFPFGNQQQELLDLAVADAQTIAKVYSVGVTNRMDIEKLKKLSSIPHQLDVNYFVSPDYSKLDTVLSKLIGESCQEIVECPVDLALLLDRSGSICNNQNVQTCQNWKDAKQFLIALIEGMTVGSGVNAARVALITFDSRASLTWNLNRYQRKEDVKNAIENLAYIAWQDTYTADALDMMMKEVFGSVGDRQNVGNAAVILTDGLPTVGEQRDRTLPLAEAAHNTGVKIFAVGVTKNISTSMLSRMSSPPHQLNQNYFTTPSYAHVNTLVSLVRQETCEIEAVTRTKFECPVDLALLLDTSGSICNNENVQTCQSWKDAKQFLIALVESMSVGNSVNAARVALITFGSQASLTWNLNRYKSNDELKNAIENLAYVSWQSTYTADALDMMINDVFGSVGDRLAVGNAAVLLTDGLPTVGDQRDRTLPLAQAAHKAGIKLFVVGVTKSISTNMLSQMSSSPHKLGENYFTSPDYAHVNTLVNLVRQGTCEIEPLRMATDCDIELVFVVDVSASVCGNQDVSNCPNWERVKDFMISLVTSLTIGPQDTRVAMVTYGNSAQIKWNLNGYTHRNSLIDAIERLAQPRKQSSTPADALSLVRNNVFHSSNVRQYTRQVAVFIIAGRPADMEQIETMVQEARQCEVAGITVVPLAITYSINDHTLKGMSSGSRELGRDYFRAPDFGRLSSVAQDMLKLAIMSQIACDNIII